LVRYQPPAEGERGDIIIRNDTGVYEGGEISIYYDPMIAKLCTHAPTRLAAIDAMAAALDEFNIQGINHNIAFLDAIMHHEHFRGGKFTTAFIAQEYPDGFHGRPIDEAIAHRFVAAAVAAKIMRATRASQITGTLNGRHPTAGEYVVTLNGAYGDKNLAVNDAHMNEGRLFLRIDGKPFSAATDWHLGQPVMHLREKDGEYALQISRRAGGYRVVQGGAHATVTVRRPEASELAALMPKKKAADTSKFLLCPMPGLVVSVNVKEGQDVKAGESLAVVEAMKMENVLTAERDSKVKKVNAKKGDSLALDDVIIEFA
jgi:propionyl-CoA carboxylase alpha chain